MNQLDALKKITIVVVDSGDIESIKKYNAHDATTNPSLILNSVYSKKYEYIIDDSILYAKKKGGSFQNKIINASDMISVRFGCEILKHIPGYISTEVDARISFDKHACIAKAKKIIELYQENNIDSSRVLIKLASTWEGIQAAKHLKKNNIASNLTLLFSFAQAKACADADVFLISPFVGRISDWYKNNNPTQKYSVVNDPGVIAVKNIYQYYKQYGYNTIIMAASFRTIEQVIALSGCDRITISPVLLSLLKNNKNSINRQLDIKNIKVITRKPDILTESEFRFLHNNDKMAVEKLSEGIRQFSYDQQLLEKFIADRL